MGMGNDWDEQGRRPQITFSICNHQFFIALRSKGPAYVLIAINSKIIQTFCILKDAARANKIWEARKNIFFPRTESELKKSKIKWAVHVGRYGREGQYTQNCNRKIWMDETISTTRVERSEQQSKNLHEMERVGAVEYAISCGNDSESSGTIKSGLLKFSKNVATTSKL